MNSVSLSGANLTGQGNSVNAFSNTASAIPAPLLNTVGNIMQGCVDSAGGSAFCSSLFSAASATGATVPANTLQAALNIVQNPIYNVTNLYTLQLPNAPFLPALAAAPTSFAISIFYGVTYNGQTGVSLNQFPVDVALDASDNAWVLYADNVPGSATYSAVDEWLANGKHNAAGTQNTSYVYPTQIAIDPSGNVFSTNNDPNTASNDVILQLNAGALRSLGPLPGVNGIALNSSGTMFVSSTSAAVTGSTSVLGSIFQYAVSGSGSALLLTYKNNTAPVGPVYGLAVDTSQNVWGTGQNNSGVVETVLWPKTTSTTTPYKASANYTATFSGASAPSFVAAGSGTTIYFPMNSELMSASYISSILNVNSAVASVSGAAIPHRSEVDGSGRVFWTDLESTGNVNYYTSTLSPSVSSFLPCFVVPSQSGYICLTDSNQNKLTASYTPGYLRSMAIDSAGNIWYVADAGFGAIIETLGVATPTWPLLSYGHPGAKP